MWMTRPPLAETDDLNPASSSRLLSGKRPTSSHITRSNELAWPADRSLLRHSNVPVELITFPGYGDRRNRRPCNPLATAMDSTWVLNSSDFSLLREAIAPLHPGCRKGPHKVAETQNRHPGRLRVLPGNGTRGLVSVPAFSQELLDVHGERHRLSGRRMASWDAQNIPRPPRQLGDRIGRDREREHLGAAGLLTLAFAIAPLSVATREPLGSRIPVGHGVTPALRRYGVR